MTLKWDTTVLGRKLEAENGIQAIRDQLNTPCPQTRMESFTLGVPKWCTANIVTFCAVKSRIGLSNMMREDWCSVKILMGANKLPDLTQKSQHILRAKFDQSYISTGNSFSENIHSPVLG